MKAGITLLATIALMSSSASAQKSGVLDAAASDPLKMGWMQGTPPPAEKRSVLTMADI